MTALLIFLLSVNSCYFLRLSPGVLSQGLGGATIMVDEGLSAFHNPAHPQTTKFNVTLSRWLYSTNFFSLGVSYIDYSLGVSYFNYGSIQGFNEHGVPTSEFTPYNVCVALGRKFGPVGFAIKTFQEKIESYSLFGVCAGISSYININKVSFGIKIDNLGKEFTQQSNIPIVAALGVRIGLPKDIDIITEIKIPEIEVNVGLLYRYQSIKLFFGTKYLRANTADHTIKFSDLLLSGGMIIRVENYEIGYSFVYTEFSTAHQFAITFTSLSQE